MPKQRKDKKSPLKHRPLRLPGESVQEELDHLIERFIQYAFAGVFCLAMILMEWIRSLHQTPPAPWLITILGVLGAGYCVKKILGLIPKARQLNLARDGERTVAEQLDVLKKDGAAIIHDIVADGFNIDHVVLSKHGIFVIETKTRSKPAKGNPKVTYDGNVLLVDGYKPDRDPITQVEASSRWLANELHASTGKTFPIKPVVLFPGWFVESNPRAVRVWVLEPKALPKWVVNEPVKISDPDVHLATYHLTRIVRG